MQVLGGSATASRRTIDRLNTVLRNADIAAGSGRLGWRGGKVAPVRAAGDVDERGDSEAHQETGGAGQGEEGAVDECTEEVGLGAAGTHDSQREYIVPRAVTVPKEVADTPKRNQQKMRVLSAIIHT